MLPNSMRVCSLLCLLLFSLLLSSAANGQRTVSGRVSLDRTDISAINPLVPLGSFLFDLCATDRPLHISRAVTLSANGSYSVSGLPAASYNVYVRGAKWLRVVKSVNLTLAQSAVLNFAMNGGDGNLDNSVDTSDFGLLVGCYNGDISVPGSGYDSNADFDCSGTVDTTDFAILLGAYNQNGERFATNLQSSGTMNSVTLTWDGSHYFDAASASDVSGYNLYRAQAGATQFTPIQNNITGTSFTDNTVVPGVVYYYKVTAGFVPGVESLPSNMIIAAADSILNDIPAPDWAADAVPVDTPDSDIFGPSSADVVNLASGVYENHPGPDMIAHNFTGPDASYERMYHSGRAAHGYSSPGLPVGWVDNYDYTIQGPVDNGGSLKFIYPNGAVEILTPPANPTSGQTVAFGAPIGVPYQVTGVWNSSAQTWQSIQLTWTDETIWNFSMQGVIGIYRLDSISDTSGIASSKLQINRNSDSTIRNISGSIFNLLKFTYDGYSHLTKITEAASGRYLLSDSGYDIYQINSSSKLLWSNSNDMDASGFGLLNKFYLASPNHLDQQSNRLKNNQITYRTGGKVAMLMDANGNKRMYSYSSNKTVVNIVGSDGAPVQTWCQFFNAQGFDTGVMDASQDRDTTTYDPMNPFQPKQFTYPVRQPDAFTYETFGKISTETEPSNGQSLITAYKYKTDAFALGRLDTVTIDGLTPVKYDYYGPSDFLTVNGQMVKQPNGYIKTVYTPTPGTKNSSSWVRTIYTYTALGNVATVSVPGPYLDGDTDGKRVIYTFNYTTDPLDATYSTGEALGQPVAIIDPNNNVVRYHYYGKYLTSSYDGLGNRTDYTYAGMGNSLVGTTQNRDYSQIVSDQIERVILPATGNTGPGNATVLSHYSYYGGPLDYTEVYDESLPNSDGLGKRVRSYLNNFGNEGEVIDNQGSSEPNVFMQYDARYRPQTLRNALPDPFPTTIGDRIHAETNTFDQNGNLMKKGFAFSQTNSSFDALSFNYNGDYAVTSRTDGNGYTTIYTPAPDDDRLTKTTYPTNTTPVTVNYDYDAYVRIKTINHYSGVSTYDYDDLGNVITATTQYANIPDINSANLFTPKQTITYTYNADGSRASMTVSRLGTTTYSYDPGGRLISVTWPWESSGYHFEYYGNNLLKHEWNSRVDTTYTYDAQNRLTGLQQTVPNTTTVLASYTNFTYDTLGNRTNYTASIQPLGGIASYNPSGSRGYSYDTMDRLTGESTTVTGTNIPRWGNNYDSDQADNLTTLRSQQEFYNQDDVFGVSQARFPNGETGNGSPFIVYCYDAAHQRYTNAFASYDREERLAGISTDGYTADSMWTYREDGLVGRRDNRAPLGNTYNFDKTFYLYDGTQVIGEFDANGNFTAAFGWGANGLVQRFLPGKASFTSYTFDPQGSVVARYRSTDPVGKPYEMAFYDAFGLLQGNLRYDATVSSTPQPTDPYDEIGFCGQWGCYTDPKTRLVQMGFRTYAPQMARFVTRDPLGHEAGLNLYAYCRNNPVTHADPMGLDGFGDWLDSHLLGGSISRWGEVQGRYDAGQATKKELALAAVNGSAQVVLLATSVVDGAALVQGGVKTVGRAVVSKVEAAALKKTEKTYITYIIKDAQGEVAYVGKASGVGSPRQVLQRRLTRGHDHFFAANGDTAHVIATQGNKAANAGAEDVWHQYYTLRRAKLRNIKPPLSTRSYRLAGTRRKIQAYAEDLRR